MTTFPNQIFPCLEPDPLSLPVKREFLEDLQPTYSLVPKIELKTEPGNTFLRAVDPLALCGTDSVAQDISPHGVKIEREEVFHETNTRISTFGQFPTEVLTNELVPQTPSNDYVSLLMKNLLAPSLEKCQTASLTGTVLTMTEDSYSLDIIEHKLEKFDPHSSQSKERSSIELKPTTQGTGTEEMVQGTIYQKAINDEAMLETSITSLNESFMGNQIVKGQIISTSPSKAFRPPDYGINHEMIIGLCEAPVIPQSSQSASCIATKGVVETKQSCKRNVVGRNFSPIKNNRIEATTNLQEKLNLRKRKDYACADCSPTVSFVSKWSLSQHIKTVHLKLFYFKCKVCGKVLDRRKLNKHMSRHVIQPRTDKYLELEKTKSIQVNQYNRISRPKIQKPVKIDQNLTAEDNVGTKDKQMTEKKKDSFRLIGYPKPVSGQQAELEQTDYDVNQRLRDDNQENVSALESTGVAVKTIPMRSSPLEVEHPSSANKLHCSVGEQPTNYTPGIVRSKIINPTTPQETYLDAFNRFWQTQHKGTESINKSIPRTITKNIQCPKCPKVCYSEFHLGTHIVAHHTPYICNDCSPEVSFPKKIRLRRHIEMVHLKSHRYKCKICGDMLCKKQEKKHMSIHKRKKILCPHCQINFPGVQKLMEHLKIHTGNAAYPCRYCVEYFEKRQVYVKHLRSEHSSERNIICEYCGERFFNVTNLHTHKAKHTGKYRCACPNCGREFVHKHQLAAHVGTIACQQAALAARGAAVEKTEKRKRKSTTRNQFECANCNEHFPLKRPLIVHIKSKICETQAASSSKIKNTLVHDGNTVAPPKGKRFGKKEDGKMVKKSKNPVACANCKESFKLKRHLIIHLKTKICEGQISENTKSTDQGNDAASLSNTTDVPKKGNRTVISKSKNPVICANCKESFKLKRHLIVHLKTKICEAQTSSSLENTIFTIQDSNTAPLANTQKKENGKVISNSNKPLTCANCKESFKLKCHLNTHLKMKICEAQILNFSENTKSTEQGNDAASLSNTTDVPKKGNRTVISKSKNPVVCANCKESFKLKRHLIVHLKTKVCEAQTSTSLENTMFTIQDSNTAPLENTQKKDNKKVISNSNKPLTCANCKESFKLKRHLNTHLKMKICEAQTSNFSEHTECIDHGGKNTPSSKRKTIGKEIAKSKNLFVCANCEESFKLNRHLIIHLKTTICKAQTSNSYSTSKSAMDGDETIPRSRRTRLQTKGKIEPKLTPKNCLTRTNCNESLPVDDHLILQSRNNSRKIKSATLSKNKKYLVHQQIKGEEELNDNPKAVQTASLSRNDKSSSPKKLKKLRRTQRK